MAVDIGGSTSARSGPSLFRTAMVQKVNMLAITYEHLLYDGRYGRLLMRRLYEISRKTTVREVNMLATTYEMSLVWRVAQAPFARILIIFAQSVMNVIVMIVWKRCTRERNM